MRLGRMNNLVRVHRAAETRNPRGATTKAFTPIGEVWVAIRELRRGLQNYGAGELPSGSMEAETHRESNIQARDVLEVIAGPEVGTKWKIEGIHHPERSAVAVLSAHNGPITTT